MFLLKRFLLFALWAALLYLWSFALPSSKGPLLNLAKKPWFLHLLILAKSIWETLWNLSKLCEIINCKTLLNVAKHCKSIFAKTTELKACKSLRNHVCKNLQTLVFLHKHICESLQEYMHFALVNPCENTICKNLAKCCERCTYASPPTPTPTPTQA